MPLVAPTIPPVAALTYPTRRLETATGEEALQGEGFPMTRVRGLEKERGRGLEKERGRGRRAREEHALAVEAARTGWVAPVAAA